MTTFLAFFTYFAYLFIITMYTRKAVKYLRLPTHIRWELYPVMHEENYAYGGSIYEHADWWEERPHKGTFRSIAFFLKEYLTFGSYFKWQRSYWFFLFVCHVGFVMLMVFQVLSLLSAIVTVSGVPLSGARVLHYLVPSAGVISFVGGLIGSAGLFVKRMTNKDLNAAASPETYFGYIFNLILSAAGLLVWYFYDPSFSQYTGFWKGMITLRPAPVEPATAILILLLALHLIYLPFTRAFHYISRIFAYFLVRWDDKPNLRGSPLEERLDRLFDQSVTWSAPHIQSGKKWKEVVRNRDGEKTVVQ